MIKFSSQTEPIKFKEIKRGQWFRCESNVYMKFENILSMADELYNAVDVHGIVASFDEEEVVDEVYVGTYTVTLT